MIEVFVVAGILGFVIGLVQACAGADKWQTARQSYSWLKDSDVREAKKLTLSGLTLVLVSVSDFLMIFRGG